MRWAALLAALCCAMLVARAQSQLPESHLHRADRAKWDAILKIPSDCQERFSQTLGDLDDAGLEFDRLDRTQSLVIVDCYPGAYQPGVILYLLEDPTRRAERLTLEGVESDTDLDGKALPYQLIPGFVHFRAGTRTLEILQEYRGLGDCGRLLRYHYRSGSFTLFEFREQEQCGTNGSVGSTNSDHWPLKPKP